MRRHHERDVPHLLACDLIHPRKILLVHELQLTAPYGVGHRHDQHAIHEAQGPGPLRDRCSADYRPSQQRGLSPSSAANLILEDFLQCAARVLHGMNVDSSIAQAWEGCA